MMADDVAKDISVPLLHIADATAEIIKQRGINKVALLGTRFTMEEDFYKGRLTEMHGIDVIVPDDNDRQTIHNIIYNELCVGEVKNSSRETYVSIIGKLAKSGAEGVILGCTEIPLLIQQSDVHLPIFDTTRIHAEAAVQFALG